MDDIVGVTLGSDEVFLIRVVKGRLFGHKTLTHCYQSIGVNDSESGMFEYVYFLSVKLQKLDDKVQRLSGQKHILYVKAMNQSANRWIQSLDGYNPWRGLNEL